LGVPGTARSGGASMGSGAGLAWHLVTMSTPPRLRIAFVADSLHSHSGGGILSGEYVVARLRRDHDVTTIASDGDDVLPALELPIRAMREMRFVMARPDRAVLARVFAKADVVHLQLPFWLSFAALEEARRLHLPVVAAFHVQPENALRNVGIQSAWLNDSIYRLLVNRFYNKVDAVLCPTEFAAQKLRHHRLTTPTAVISNGIPPDVAQAMAANPPNHGRRAGPFFILAVGRFAAEKRQDVIIEAVRRSRHRDEIRLVLSGWGPRQAELGRLASGLPNGAEINFLPREALLEDYRTADLFVHASEVELEGMSVLESMSAGVPALIADAPESAASKFALDDFTFPAGDAATLAAKIDALIEDPARLEAAGQRYRERARQFDFDASVAKLVGLYRSVIDGAASQRATG
jgi:1,2-diacylglycerol 3-alpha-glucosyltransferase